MDNKELVKFLLKARTNTYAGAGGKIKAVFEGSKQMEYKEGEWFYRDVFYVGKGIFAGLEAVYFKEKPIFTMSYFGNYKGMTEKETDKILRQALIENWEKTRIWKYVKWEKYGYEYTCEPDGGNSIEEIGGTEKISKKGKDIYTFYYAGGAIG